MKPQGRRPPGPGRDGDRQWVLKLAGSKQTKRGRRLFRRGLGLFLKAALIVILLTCAQVALLRFVNPPFTAGTAYEWVRHKIRSKPYHPPRRQWRPLKDISPWIIKAVLAGEDQRFMEHYGFDFIEMQNAFRDILSDKRIRGASTITMQVSRSVFLWPDRSLLRKAAEAYYTILLELFLSKVRIMEIYLNMVDWGPGIMGAEAAAQKYFQVSSADVTPSQAARMAAILPSPHAWSPSSPNEHLLRREKRIMKDMEKMHL